MKIATQKLQNNAPGKFYEERYAIPFELGRGKTDSLGKKIESVTVKFEAVDGTTAGGLFGLRVAPAKRPK